MKTIIIALISLVNFSVFADSSTTIYVCSSHSPAISQVYLDEVGHINEFNEVIWKYTLSIEEFNQDTGESKYERFSTDPSHIRSFKPGLKGFAVFGDKSMASHGVVPNSTIVAKTSGDDLRVVIDGDTYYFSCKAMTQADF
jgi:hypothetical protein